MNRKLAHSIAKMVRSNLRCNQAVAAVEFAILAPMFLLMMIGILQVGIFMQNYNAVQSLASDGARYVMVEYQKENRLSDNQIRSVLLGLSTNLPYGLNSDRLEINVGRANESRVTGATEIDLEFRYTLVEFLPGVELPLTVVSYTRSVWVTTA